MDFWKKHGEELRKSRLLQASAILYSELGKRFYNSEEVAVSTALELEKEIDRQIKGEKHG